MSNTTTNVGEIASLHSTLDGYTVLKLSHIKLSHIDIYKADIRNNTPLRTIATTVDGEEIPIFFTDECNITIHEPDRGIDDD